jgi:hypothetical protein
MKRACGTPAPPRPPRSPPRSSRHAAAARRDTAGRDPRDPGHDARRSPRCVRLRARAHAVARPPRARLRDLSSARWSTSVVDAAGARLDRNGQASEQPRSGRGAREGPRSARQRDESGVPDCIASASAGRERDDARRAARSEGLCDGRLHRWPVSAASFRGAPGLRAPRRRAARRRQATRGRPHGRHDRLARARTARATRPPPGELLRSACTLCPARRLRRPAERTAAAAVTRSRGRRRAELSPEERSA